jgi:hypothetical protein
MAIEVVHDNEPRWWPAEHCCFCFEPTRFWYTAKDVAVCEPCAGTHVPEDVPSKAIWCEAVGAREKERELAFWRGLQAKAAAQASTNAS